MDALANEWSEDPLDEWGVGLIDKQFISEEELLDEPPLPHSYTMRENVEKIEFGRAIIHDAKYEELERSAKKCQNAELKKILERRLKDFADFDFAYIADFYQSGANAEERTLLEEFGLVIATEKKALELDLLKLERSVILSGGDYEIPNNCY